MGQHYSQISFGERRRIQDLRDAKVPVAAIAEELGRHRSTIHREIRRNFYHDPFRDRWGKEYKGYYCTSAQNMPFWPWPGVGVGRAWAANRAAPRSHRSAGSPTARRRLRHGKISAIGNAIW